MQLHARHEKTERCLETCSTNQVHVSQITSLEFKEELHKSID